MTPPAGPEEVRVREWVKSQIMGEQCWEDVISVANATIEDDEWLMVDEAIEEHNALRSAYVALQARVKELKPWIQHMLDCDKNVASMDGGISHFDNEQACTCGLAEALSRLAKLEQERGK